MSVADAVAVTVAGEVVVADLVAAAVADAVTVAVAVNVAVGDGLMYAGLAHDGNVMHTDAH